MFVGHQEGGVIYAIDLHATVDAAVLVGQYGTAENEVAGLEFDRSTGKLYIWHGGSPLALEEARLPSTPTAGLPRLDAVRIYAGPGVPDGGSSNVEGLAITGRGACASGARSVFLTTDDGGPWSLLRYRTFPCW